MKFVQKSVILFFIAPIYIYKLVISPFLGKNCNFYPTCSSYAILALKKYGVLSGCKMSFIRICKCNPFNKEFKHDEP